MKIEIEKTEIGWKVTVGDRYEDGLDSGEALWAVANILVKPDRSAPCLRTAQQHAEWEAKYGPPKPLEYWQKFLTTGEKTT